LPCHTALDDRFLAVSEDAVLEDVLAELESKSISYAVVIGPDDSVTGLFSRHSLLRNILPVSVNLGDGAGQGDVTIGAAPHIAKRLLKALPLAVHNFMDRTFQVLYPETPLWEGMRGLLKSNAPMVMLQSDTRQLVGLMTIESAVRALQTIKKG